MLRWCCGILFATPKLHVGAHGTAGQCVCSRLFWEALKCMSYHKLIWRTNAHTHTNRCARAPLVQPRNRKLPNLTKLCVSASAISCHRCRRLRRRGCCRRRHRRRRRRRRRHWWSFFSCCSCCSRWWWWWWWWWWWLQHVNVFMSLF